MKLYKLKIVYLIIFNNKKSNTMKSSMLVCMLLILLTGCQSSYKDRSGSLGLTRNYEAAEAVEEAGVVEADEELIPADEKKLDEARPVKIKRPDKIIKEADIKFEVDDYKKAKKEIDSIVNRWGGYISKEDERYSYNRIENTIIIRVLNNQFENLLNAIGETSKRIDYKSVNSIDVTEEYVDIVSRLKTKREVEKRYYEILRKATEIEDILAVENEIRKIREEIEAKEGRLKYLDDRVSYSTITLSIYQYLEYKYKPKQVSNFFTRFYKALDKGWKGLLSFIIGLFHIWPVILFIAAGLWLYIRLRKKNKSGKNKE